MKRRLILASKSIGRKGLFERDFGAGSFEIAVSDFDEDSIEEENPRLLTKRLAEEKAKAVSKIHPDAIVCAFDTVVLLGEEILGKPSDKNEAREMLMRSLGQEQIVVSGYAVSVKETGFFQSGYSESHLFFRPMTCSMVNEYVENNPVTKFAGGYGVQDNDFLVKLKSGDMDTVIGAPMEMIKEILKEF